MQAQFMSIRSPEGQTLFACVLQQGQGVMWFINLCKAFQNNYLRLSYKLNIPFGFAVNTHIVKPFTFIYKYV